MTAPTSTTPARGVGFAAVGVVLLALGLVAAPQPLQTCRLLDTAPLVLLTDVVEAPPGDEARDTWAETRLVLTINDKGRVDEVSIEDQTHAALARSLAKSVHGWVFDPPVYANQPVGIRLLMETRHPPGQAFPETILFWQRDCFDDPGRLHLPDGFWDQAREAGLRGVYGLSMRSDRNPQNPAFGTLPDFRVDRPLSVEEHSVLERLVADVDYDPFIRSGQAPPFQANHVLVLTPPPGQPPHWIGHFMLEAERLPYATRTPSPINRVSRSSLYDLTYRGGELRVAFTIDAKGRVRNERILESTEPGHNAAVLSTVKRWRFRPAEVDGSPVSIRVEQPISFSEIRVSPGSRSEVEIAEPEVVRAVPPVFPLDAIFNKDRGGAVVQVHLGNTGAVDSVETIAASDDDFAIAAIAAAKSSLYDPATTEAGNPAEGTLQRTFDFDYYDLDAMTRRLRAAIVEERLDPRLPEELGTLLEVPDAFHDETTAGQRLVRVKFLVAEDGHVYFAEAVDAPDPLSGYLAAQRVQDWRFDPPEADGEPARVWMEEKVAVPVSLAGW